MSVSKLFPSALTFPETISGRSEAAAAVTAWLVLFCANAEAGDKHRHRDAAASVALASSALASVAFMRASKRRAGLGCMLAPDFAVGKFKILMCAIDGTRVGRSEEDPPTICTPRRDSPQCSTESGKTE